MARSPAARYRKVITLTDSGDLAGSAYYALYEEGNEQERITQQAFSAARNRGASVEYRVQVPTGFDVEFKGGTR